MLPSGFKLIDLDKGSRIMLGVLKEKQKASVCIHFGLLFKFLEKSESKFFHPDQESERRDI